MAAIECTAIYTNPITCSVTWSILPTLQPSLVHLWTVKHVLPQSGVDGIVEVTHPMRELPSAGRAGRVAVKPVGIQSESLILIFWVLNLVILQIEKHFAKLFQQNSNSRRGYWSVCLWNDFNKKFLAIKLCEKFDLWNVSVTQYAVMCVLENVLWSLWQWTLDKWAIFVR